MCGAAFPILKYCLKVLTAIFVALQVSIVNNIINMAYMSYNYGYEIALRPF